MTKRIEQELSLLSSYYPAVEYVEEGQWFLIRDYVLPCAPTWNKEKMDVCFQVLTGYPGSPPYGFYVPSDLKYEGSPPQNNYKSTPPAIPPFEGSWGFFSWSHDSTWRATADMKAGSNLTNFARTFAGRLKQGV